MNLTELSKLIEKFESITGHPPAKLHINYKDNLEMERKAETYKILAKLPGLGDFSCFHTNVKETSLELILTHDDADAWVE